MRLRESPVRSLTGAPPERGSGDGLGGVCVIWVQDGVCTVMMRWDQQATEIPRLNNETRN